MEIVTNNAYWFCTATRETDFNTNFLAINSHHAIHRGEPYQYHSFNDNGWTTAGITFALDSSLAYPGTGWSDTCRLIITGYENFGTTQLIVGSGNGGTYSDVPFVATTLSLTGRHGESFVGGFDLDLTFGGAPAAGDFVYVKFSSPGTSQKLKQLCMSSPIVINYKSTNAVIRSSFYGKVRIGQRIYRCDEQIQIEFIGLTPAQVNTIFASPQLVGEPFFLYDSSGDYFAEELVHVVCPALPTVVEADDRYNMSFRVLRLEDRRFFA